MKQVARRAMARLAAPKFWLTFNGLQGLMSEEIELDIRMGEKRSPGMGTYENCVATSGSANAAKYVD
jgi:hypothetical protein